MHTIIYGNSLLQWLSAILTAFFLAIVLRFLKKFITDRLRATGTHASPLFIEYLLGILSSTQFLFISIISLYLSSLLLVLPPSVNAVLSRIVFIAVLIQVGLWVDKGLSVWLDKYQERKRAEDIASVTTTAALGLMGHMAIWIITVLLILENWGVNITTLLASLGIGGIAVALAVQNILGDIFASLSIVLDKPFVVGDSIQAGDASGTVEYIGLKTTRIRSLSGEQIIFSNAELLKSRIRNYKRMSERRVAFTIGVNYDTQEEQLQAIPGFIKEVVGKQPKTRFDRAHFKEYTFTALNFEVVYFVSEPDYALYMNIQQNINLAILGYFAKAGIKFAHAPQILYDTDERKIAV